MSIFTYTMKPKSGSIDEDSNLNCDLEDDDDDDEFFFKTKTKRKGNLARPYSNKASRDGLNKEKQKKQTYLR